MHGLRVLVDIHVSSCLATRGSPFLDAIGRIRFVRFGTRKSLAFSLAGLSGLGGFGGPVGDSRGSGGSPGASVHGHSDDESGLFGVMEARMMI